MTIIIRPEHEVLIAQAMQSGAYQNADAVIDRAYFKTVYQSISPFGSRTDNVSPELKLGANQYKFDLKKADKSIVQV